MKPIDRVGDLTKKLDLLEKTIHVLVREMKNLSDLQVQDAGNLRGHNHRLKELEERHD